MVFKHIKQPFTFTRLLFLGLLSRPAAAAADEGHGAFYVPGMFAINTPPPPIVFDDTRARPVRVFEVQSWPQRTTVPDPTDILPSEEELEFWERREREERERGEEKEKI